MRPPLPPPSLAGQRWLITGANRGIGFETAAALAARGATVLLACRSPSAAAAAAAAITARLREGGDDDGALVGAAVPAPAPLDLASPSSVAACAAAVAGAAAAPLPLHGLVCNAAAVGELDPARPSWPGVGADDATLATSHVGHFALTLLLLPSLLAAAAEEGGGGDDDGGRGERGRRRSRPRVVVVSSRAHVWGAFARRRADDGGAPLSLAALAPPLAGPFAALRRYSRAKLANTLFAAALPAATGGRVACVAASPGFVATGLAADLLARAPRPLALLARALAKTPAGGAAAVVYAATDEAAGDAPAPAFAHAGRLAPWLVPAAGRDPMLADEVWAATARAVEEAGVRLG